jgi:hypothetical protein
MDQTNTQTFAPPPGAPPPGPEVQPAQDVTPNDGIAKGQSPLAPQSPFAQSAVPQPYQDESAAYARKAEADKAAWEKRQAAWAPVEEKLRKELLAGNPPPPEQQRLPAPPSMDPQRYQQNALAFVGVMAVMGALAGKFTRNAGNASLNAFAGAVKGWQTGNLEAYEQKSKEWQDTTQQMLANNKMVLDKYKAVLENKSLNIEQQMMAAKLIAAEYQDKIAFDALDAGNYTMFAQLHDKQTAAQDKAVESFLKLSGDKFHETEQNQAKAKQLETPEGQAWMQGLDPASRMKLEGFLKVYGTGAPPLSAGSSPQANRGNTPENVDAIAKGIADGTQPPQLTGLYGMSGPVRAKLQQQGFDLAKAQIEWTRAQKQIQALNGPQMTRFVGLAQSVTNTIDEVRNLSHQMQMSGIPALNKLELQSYIQTQGNSPNGQLATRYMEAVGVLKEEFANLASGGYAPHESAWDLASQQINGSYGVQQLDAALGEVKRLINYRVQGIPGLSGLGAGAPNRYTGGGGGGASETPAPAGDNEQTATNPNTGETVVLRNGKWVPK